MSDAAPATVSALLRGARTQVAHEDADLLLAHVLERPRGWLFAHGDDPVPAAAAAAFGQLLARRLQGEPLAYITGHRGFWRFDLAVSPATLIPRPETELLVELSLARMPQSGAHAVADLGTGSGAIALALACERPDVQVIATDVSDAALAVARGNARMLGLSNVDFRQGDWFEPLRGERLALIASNPPYIALGDAHLEQGDLRFEPAGALSSGADGLDAIRAIAGQAPRHLLAGGWLLVEHGWEQGAAVRALLAGAGLLDVATHQDLEARDRVTLGRAAN